MHLAVVIRPIWQISSWFFVQFSLRTRKKLAVWSYTCLYSQVSAKTLERLNVSAVCTIVFVGTTQESLLPGALALSTALVFRARTLMLCPDDGSCANIRNVGSFQHQVRESIYIA